MSLFQSVVGRIFQKSCVYSDQLASNRPLNIRTINTAHEGNPNINCDKQRSRFRERKREREIQKENEADGEKNILFVRGNFRKLTEIIPLKRLSFQSGCLSQQESFQMEFNDAYMKYVILFRVIVYLSML